MQSTSFTKDKIYGIRYIVQDSPNARSMWLFLTEKRCDEEIVRLHTVWNGISHAEKVVFVLDESQTKVVK